MKTPLLILTARVAVAGTITFNDVQIGSVPDGVYNGGEVTVLTGEQHFVRGGYVSELIPGTGTIQQFPIGGRSANPFLYIVPKAHFSDSTLKYMADGGYDYFAVNRYTFVDLDFRTPIDSLTFDFFRGIFTVDLTATGILSTGESFEQTQKIGSVAAWEQIDLSAPAGGLLKHIHIETFQNDIGLDSIHYSGVPDSSDTALLVAMGCLGLVAFGRGVDRQSKPLEPARLGRRNR